MSTPFIPKPFSLADIDLDKELGICTPKDQPCKRPAPLRVARSQKLFIKGPIPFDWLQEANAIGGSTGIVAVALWFYVGLSGAKRFKIDSRLDQLCGLTRQTRDQVLQRLDYAGLIELAKKRGSYPIVAILDYLPS
jgi:hypothetical protein